MGVPKRPAYTWNAFIGDTTVIRAKNIVLSVEADTPEEAMEKLDRLYWLHQHNSPGLSNRYQQWIQEGRKLQKLVNPPDSPQWKVFFDKQQQDAEKKIQDALQRAAEAKDRERKRATRIREGVRQQDFERYMLPVLEQWAVVHHLEYDVPYQIGVLYAQTKPIAERLGVFWPTTVRLFGRELHRLQKQIGNYWRMVFSKGFNDHTHHAVSYVTFYPAGSSWKKNT